MISGMVTETLTISLTTTMITNKRSTQPDLFNQVRRPLPTGANKLKCKRCNTSRAGCLTRLISDETPFLGSFIHQDDKPAMIARAKEFMKRRFRRVNFGKLVSVIMVNLRLFNLAQGVVSLLRSSRAWG